MSGVIFDPGYDSYGPNELTCPVFGDLIQGNMWGRTVKRLLSVLVLLLLLAIPAVLFAKAETSKIVIKGADLSASISRRLLPRDKGPTVEISPLHSSTAANDENRGTCCLAQ